MKILVDLEQHIQDTVKLVEIPTLPSGDIDTRTSLYNLALAPEWSEAEWEKVDFFSKRMDISCKLFLGYLNSGRKATNSELADPVWLDLAVAIFLKAAFLVDEGQNISVSLKRFNTMFKAMDISRPGWLSPDSEIGKSMESKWKSLTSNLPVPPEIHYGTENSELHDQAGKELAAIPLTVLFYEGPIARAYLETIRSLGFKPTKIVELVAARDVSTKKLVGKWLPRGMRASYAASIQRSKISYWPRQLLKTQAGLVEGILNEVRAKFGIPRATIDRAYSLLPLSSFSDHVESILVESLSDSGLQQFLSHEPAGAILFTGGGIVPAALLDIQHLKFLHIHPGYLPKIRGADCALWSALLTGNTSATCFYMSPGIDTGDIISPCWLPKLVLDVNAKDAGLSTLYRAVYGFLDPWVRAYVLRAVLMAHRRYDDLEAVAQSDGDGTTFHFMHKRLQQAAFEQLFNL
jgi:hypothetical protein